MLGFLIGVAVLCAVLALPLLLFASLVRVLLALIALPFRLVGLVFKLSLGVAGLLLKVVFGILGLVLGLVLIPLLPLALLAFVFWGVSRVLTTTPLAAR